MEDNTEKCFASWNKLVTKRDVVYVLGDAVFTTDALTEFKKLPGRKHLVRGNHDALDTGAYLKAFEQVYGLLKYNEFWLSHAPIHPNELRGRVNLHGHVHYSTIQSHHYFNCCSENLLPICEEWLISLDQLREYFGTLHRYRNNNQKQGSPVQSGE
jgi:calcineurin-like phosphoesterase family protein